MSDDERLRDAVELYKSGKSLRETAHLTGLSYHAVRNHLLRNQVPLRSRGDYRRTAKPDIRQEDGKGADRLTLRALRAKYPGVEIIMLDGNRVRAIAPGLLITTGAVAELDQQLAARTDMHAQKEPQV